MKKTKCQIKNQYFVSTCDFKIWKKGKCIINQNQCYKNGDDHRFYALELDWLRYGGESLFTIVLNLAAIVRDTPEVIRARERLYVPNKLGNIR
ncbi:plasmid SOS inhibition protein A [Photorhabdus khanii]|uniref:Uncharacterized protein n=1 Tax=Photorhabdus khanii subsp. guanajuatensis TaxID=2100166 RepID=A0A4R4IWV9_9GAMM|nr:plasmid SOS inhibition protein A [Photorhabdus khanii]TDB45172.1 hypothetical protein C5467_22445 [Photorhabdus khanii subsp. guanajuatensis]